MPRSLRPERYPPECFEVTLEAARRGGFTVPCESPTDALGLRTSLYYFWAALARAGESGPASLAKRLIAAQRLPESLGQEGSGFALQCASDLLAAANNLSARVEAGPPARVVIEQRSDTKYARTLRAALDAGKPGPGGGVEESLARLKAQMEAEK